MLACVALGKDWLKRNGARTLAVGAASFVVIPLGVYLASYIPQMLAVHGGLQAVIDNQTSMCTSGSGGEDVVVDFELPGTTDLTVGWRQFGRHDFTIFPAAGSFSACDALPTVACIHAADQGIGAQVVSRLPKGKYHLVIDADTAGDEGSLLLAISGTASP